MVEARIGIAQEFRALASDRRPNVFSIAGISGFPGGRNAPPHDRFVVLLDDDPRLRMVIRSVMNSDSAIQIPLEMMTNG